MKLDIEECRSLRDYIEFIPFSVDSLKNVVLGFMLNRNIIGDSENIIEECKLIVYDIINKGTISLIDLKKDIEQLDVIFMSVYTEEMIMQKINEGIKDEII
jgi:hypothetical protein